MSRFISAGTSDEPPTSERDEAWLKAQQQIEAARLQTQQKPRPGEQEGGKSLYETLQANKGDYPTYFTRLYRRQHDGGGAAKQEKFEEDAKLKNQFRSLDDDEVEFLDSMMESTRAKEAEVRKQTRDQLDAFRRQQMDAEKAAATASQGDEGGESEKSAIGAETWIAGPRKRKKGREGLLGGVKVRRTSTVGKDDKTAAASPVFEDVSAWKTGPAASAPRDEDEAGDVGQALSPETKVRKLSASLSPPKPPAPMSLGLGAYSSDEDD